ncbi:MAG: biosynthetic arginine decarboxylase [Thermoanaerobaculia bacterium]|nr:biosynthetic arginine decarboxylase [Thermoanaerobaculia bacterium]
MSPTEDATRASDTTAPPWTLDRSRRLYGIHAWGKDYFSVNDEGHICMGPTRTASGDPGPVIDIQELVEEVKERGIGLPLLIRFSDLLKTRIAQIHDTFRHAIEQYSYTGAYRGVYPIKVNQNRYLVEDLVNYGREFHFGLEAGSKPELMAVMALLDDPDALIVCNGYKDEEYIETALLASRLGPKVILVAEKPSELRHIVQVSRRTGIRPVVGMRARLSSKGAGRWEASGGDRSKFGLGARELMEAVEYLSSQDMLDCLELLHFHLGSQISSIHNIKGGIREGAWLYVNLVKLGAPLIYFDAGGGLGVDYDGSQSNFASSMNYSLQEYANDVVAGLMEACDPAGVPHPHLVTEAGRATVAHHAVLVAEVLGVGEFRVGQLPAELPEDAGIVLRNLHEAHKSLSLENLRELYHDAQQYREDVLNLFNLGHMSLEHRVLAEDFYWALCSRVRALVRDLPSVPPELQGIEESLADTYFCNFSLFQSLPDSWAIDQLFPVVPIHRLDEEPTRRGTLADITCDSDGKVDRFVRSSETPRFDTGEVRRVLELHEVGDEPYHLGFFLVGAYQEILGDLHNLFGDTHAIHVTIDDEGEYEIEHFVPGDSVTEVLRYVEYQREDLIAKVRRRAERAIRRKKLSREEARCLMKTYEEGLAGYTYLERD